MFLFLVVALLVLQGTVSFKVPGPHLADVSVLLPPKMTHPVEYRLQGIGGCFEWSWDDHDLLDVLPEYNSSNHCSTSARLRSIAPYKGRKETSVYASDVSTGVVIRCKVFIDNLSRIQIFHTCLKLGLDEIAILRVRAFDKEGNVFNSLAGLQFMWELGNHLVHVPLKDSPVRDSDVQINLEDNGVYSDLYLVKGDRIGHENVSVHLHEHHRKDLADKIVLIVVEATSLHSPNNPNDQETMMSNLTPDNDTSFITLVVNADDQVHFSGRGSIKVSTINKEDSGVGGRVVFEDTMMLNLTLDNNTSFTTLVMSTDHQIHFDGRGSIKVSPTNNEDSGVGGRVMFEVKLLKPTRYSEKTIITHTTNDQKIKVEADFEERHEPPPYTEWDYMLRRALYVMLVPTAALIISMWLTHPSPAVQLPPAPVQNRREIHIPEDLPRKLSRMY